jgi:hypothetical protein
VVLFTEPDELSGDAETNFAVLEKAGTPVTRAADIDETAYCPEIQIARDHAASR